MVINDTECHRLGPNLAQHLVVTPDMDHLLNITKQENGAKRVPMKHDKGKEKEKEKGKGKEK